MNEIQRKYSSWLEQQNGEKETLLEHVVFFHQNRDKFIYKNLYQYTADDLAEEIKNKNLASKRAIKKEMKVEGAEHLYKDKYCSIIRIDTFEAMKYYGKNTKWCVTNKIEFDEYMDDYILYILNLNKSFKNDIINFGDKFCLAVHYRFKGTVIEIHDEQDEHYMTRVLSEKIKNIILEDFKKRKVLIPKRQLLSLLRKKNSKEFIKLLEIYHVGFFNMSCGFDRIFTTYFTEIDEFCKKNELVNLRRLLIMKAGHCKITKSYYEDESLHPTLKQRAKTDLRILKKCLRYGLIKKLNTKELSNLRLRFICNKEISTKEAVKILGYFEQKR